MSMEIIKVYKQEVPAMRFVGKKYFNEDRVEGMFGKHWCNWFENNWFEPLEKQISDNFKLSFADAEASIGLMRWKDGEPFEYWIGMFLPPNTPVPDGYEYRDFPKSTLGVCWVYGMESEVFMQEDNCAKKLEETGHKVTKDKNGVLWFFERYNCPRFTASDGNDKVILDICYYVE